MMTKEVSTKIVKCIIPVDMQICAPLTRSQCKVSDPQYNCINTHVGKQTIFEHFDYVTMYTPPPIH